jgi:cytidine deaminase
MAEFFDPEMPIYLGNLKGEMVQTSLQTLLPGSFTKRDLGMGERND